MAKTKMVPVSKKVITVHDYLRTIDGGKHDQVRKQMAQDAKETTENAKKKAKATGGMDNASDNDNEGSDNT